MANYLVRHNNIIIHNRGDSLKYPIELLTGTFPWIKKWTLEEGDLAFWGLMLPNDSFEHALIKKELNHENVDEHGNLILKLEPEDTLHLDPGTYYYEVKVLYKTENDDDIHLDTAVQKTKFIVVD